MRAGVASIVSHHPSLGTRRGAAAAVLRCHRHCPQMWTTRAEAAGIGCRQPRPGTMRGVVAVALRHCQHPPTLGRPGKACPGLPTSRRPGKGYPTSGQPNVAHPSWVWPDGDLHTSGPPGERCRSFARPSKGCQCFGKRSKIPASHPPILPKCYHISSHIRTYLH